MSNDKRSASHSPRRSSTVTSSNHVVPSRSPRESRSHSSHRRSEHTSERVVTAAAAATTTWSPPRIDERSAAVALDHATHPQTPRWLRTVHFITALIDSHGHSLRFIRGITDITSFSPSGLLLAVSLLLYLFWTHWSSLLSLLGTFVAFILPSYQGYIAIQNKDEKIQLVIQQYWIVIAIGYLLGLQITGGETVLFLFVKFFLLALLQWDDYKVSVLLFTLVAAPIMKLWEKHISDRWKTGKKRVQRWAADRMTRMHAHAHDDKMRTTTASSKSDGDNRKSRDDEDGGGGGGGSGEGTTTRRHKRASHHRHTGDRVGSNSKSKSKSAPHSDRIDDNEMDR